MKWQKGYQQLSSESPLGNCSLSSLSEISIPEDYQVEMGLELTVGPYRVIEGEVCKKMVWLFDKAPIHWCNGLQGQLFKKLSRCASVSSLYLQILHRHVVFTIFILNSFVFVYTKWFKNLYWKYCSLVLIVRVYLGKNE